MDADEQSQAAISILRIKRKRTANPLEALVLEQAVKRRKQDTFRFAETVPCSSFASQSDRSALKNRITTLVQTAQSSLISPPVVSSSSLHRQPLKKPRYRVVTNALDDTSMRIVDLEQQLGDSYPASPALSRPVSSPSKSRLLSHLPSQPSVEEDAMMADFMPMLKDYLNLQESDSLSKAPIFDHVKSPLQPAFQPISKSKSEADDDQEFVYDIYFRSNAPMQLDDPTSQLMIGQIARSDMASILEADEDGEISAQVPSDEEQDEADQDSNSEGFYGNDYPDEEHDLEPSSSDEDNDQSDSPDEDHNWR